MSKAKRFLAFIPARANSKGLPGKNMRLLAGKPLVQHTLEAALATSGSRVFVSSDDSDVIRLAESMGVSCEYKRHPSLALDKTPMADTVLDGIEWLKKREELPEIFVLLQPTSPFRRAQDIENTLHLIETGKAASVVGVSPMWTHPSDCVSLREDGSWSYILENDFQPKRRQDMDGSYWFINGAIYAMRTDFFLKEKKFVFPDSHLLRMEDENTVDIDTARDWAIAEALFKDRK